MPVVTISRGSGSEGRELADELAKRLSYTVVTREDVVQEAVKFGAPEQRLREALLESPSLLDRLTLDRKRYLAFVQAALCERARQDGIVYEGNAGHLLLGGVSHILCVRVLVPFAHRVEVTMSRLGIGRDEAVQQLESADRGRESWTRFLYGVDWLDPSLYDLTLNLRTLDLQGAVEVVAVAVRRPEFAVTEQSRASMENLCLESRIRAALAGDDDTAAAEVRVRVERGIVSLNGRVRSARVVDAVIRVVEGTSGVKGIDRDNLDAPNYTV